MLSNPSCSWANFSVWVTCHAPEKISNLNFRKVPMKKFVPYLAGCLALLSVSVAVAQDTATPPPAMIQIYREEVKPGKTSLHVKTEAAFLRDFKAAKLGPNYTALTTITGPDEAWFVARYDSYASFGKDLAASNASSGRAAMDKDLVADGELLSRSSSIVARYRADLSYRPGVSIPLTRFFNVAIVRIRPGHITDYEDARKIVKAAHEKAALKFNYSVYQVTSGMPAGTFLVMSYGKTLGDFDTATEIHGKAYDDAIGDDGRKKLNELASAGTISSESMVFAVSPKMSNPDKDTIAADPAFWAPKPAAPVMKPAAAAPKK
jgi:hypothetical protein